MQNMLFVPYYNDVPYLFVMSVWLQGWPMYAQLLIDLFKFLAPFLRNVELNKPMQILYKV